MSHSLYHTEGIILGSWPSGETSRLFDIFTNRLGRVMAMATGVRELKSKLRYHLQDLAAVQVSLVRGRGPWRIVHAETIQSRFNLDITKSRFDLGQEKVEPFDLVERQTIARIFKLLARLIIDEGRRRTVWREVFGAYHFLAQTSFTPVELADFELLVVWRILTALGYCENSVTLAPFAVRPWDKLLISDFNPARQAALLIVEQALYHSHL